MQTIFLENFTKWVFFMAQYECVWLTITYLPVLNYIVAKS